MVDFNTIFPGPFASHLTLGDPGTKNAPHRDNPVILVWKMPWH